MDKILDNKLVVVVAVALFVVALGVNSLMGGSMPAFASCLTVSDSAVTIAHGPTLPPEPWVANAIKPAHGPTLPPEPWVAAIKSAHGPTLPPEPWVTKVSKIQHGPTLPPEPWKL